MIFSKASKKQHENFTSRIKITIFNLCMTLQVHKRQLERTTTYKNLRNVIILSYNKVRSA